MGLEIWSVGYNIFLQMLKPGFKIASKGFATCFFTLFSFSKNKLRQEEIISRIYLFFFPFLM
jgi:hypothetical protein